MLKSTRFQAVVLLTLGVLLGYAAASGHMRPDWFAKAAGHTEKPADHEQSGNGQIQCCQGGVDKGEALAPLDAHNQEVAAKAAQAGKKPNILVIWGDDIGGFNISAYNLGVMGYKTPNID